MKVNVAFQMHNYFGDILINMVLGTILYLTFEEPVLLIENYVYKRIAARRLASANDNVIAKPE